MEGALLKWRLLSDGWDRLRPAALLPGGNDFFAGRALLEGRGEGAPRGKHPLPFVALNLRDRSSGRALFPPFRLASSGGQAVAVTGLWGDKVLSPHALSALGLSVSPPGEALASFLDSPESRGKVVAVLSLLPDGELETVAREARRPVLFLAPGAPGGEAAPLRILGKSAVVRVPPGGRHLFEILLSPPAAASRDGAPYADGSLVARARALRAEAEGRIRSLPPDRAAHWRKAASESDRILAACAASWTVAVRTSPLDAAAPSDPDLSRRVERHRAEAEGAARRRGADSPPRGGGAESCGKCHPERLAAWKKERHAGALASLARSGDGFNPDCVRCHAPAGVAAGTGLGLLPGGEGVGCEACHGSGKGHPPGRLAVPGEKRCLECHGLSPSFRFRDEAPRLSCYGTGKRR
jgi:hypothetical protein